MAPQPETQWKQLWSHRNGFQYGAAALFKQEGNASGPHGSSRHLRCCSHAVCVCVCQEALWFNLTHSKCLCVPSTSLDTVVHMGCSVICNKAVWLESPGFCLFPSRLVEIEGYLCPNSGYFLCPSHLARDPPPQEIIRHITQVAI